jgi:hypothetical protein
MECGDDRKKVGAEFHFRLLPKDKQVSVHELIEKLTPILKELDREIRNSLRHGLERPSAGQGHGDAVNACPYTREQ